MTSTDFSDTDFSDNEKITFYYRAPREVKSRKGRRVVPYNCSRIARSSVNESTTRSAPAAESVVESKVVVIPAATHLADFAALSPFTESSMIQQSAAATPRSRIAT